MPTASRPRPSVRNPAPPPELFSIIEAGAYCGVSRRTVYDRLIEPHGPLQTIYIGARRLVTRESLLRFIASPTRKSNTADACATSAGPVGGSTSALAPE